MPSILEPFYSVRFSVHFLFSNALAIYIYIYIDAAAPVQHMPFSTSTKIIIKRVNRNKKKEIQENEHECIDTSTQLHIWRKWQVASGEG